MYNLIRTICNDLEKIRAVCYASNLSLEIDGVNVAGARRKALDHKDSNSNIVVWASSSHLMDGPIGPKRLYEKA